MPPLTLQTERLTLYAATAETAALVARRAELSAALDARVPGNWPPEIQHEALHDDARLLARDPQGAGWRHWFLVTSEPGSPRVLIGGGGFKGPPADGQVELAYALLDAYQRRGYGSEAVAALVDWAFADERVQRVMAEAAADNRGSIRVLQKNGFRFVGQAGEEGWTRFAKDRCDQAAAC